MTGQWRNGLLVGAVAASLAGAALWAGVGDRVLYWLDGQFNGVVEVEIGTAEEIEGIVAQGWLPASMPTDIRSASMSRSLVSGHSWALFRVSEAQFEQLSNWLEATAVERPIPPNAPSADQLPAGDIHIRSSRYESVEGYVCEDGVYWHFRIAEIGWSRIHNSFWQPGFCADEGSEEVLPLDGEGGPMRSGGPDRMKRAAFRLLPPITHSTASRSPSPIKGEDLVLRQEAAP